MNSLTPNTTFDEQEYIALLYRVREQWDSGVMPPRHDIARLLAMSAVMVTETIGQRQRAATAERRVSLLEQGQGLLLRLADLPGARACTPVVRL